MKRISKTSTTTRCVLIAFAVCASQLPSVQAQTKVPYISANGFVPEAKQLVKDCNTNWAAADVLVQEIEAAYKDKEIKRVDPRKIGAAYARAAQVMRDASVLKDLREPAGVDFFLRASHQKQMLGHAAKDLRRIKNGQIVAQNAEVDFKSHTKKRVAGIKKTYSLVAKNQIAGAERTYDDLLKQVDGYYIWLSQESRKTLAMETGETKLTLDSMAAKMRSAQPPKVSRMP